MQAQAIAAQREAVAHEAARLAELKAGGFASSNEIEKSAAESASKEAQLMETRAKIDRATLEVNDCVLRAPFAGEVAARLADPGAFLRPGSAVATVIDRSKLRVTAEVPENDFAVVAPGATVEIHALAGNRTIASTITRRSPAADPTVRTVHLEIDLVDTEHALPVGTTAELTVDAGAPIAAAEVPLSAASVRGTKATLFTVDGEWAHKRTFAVHGERQGALLLDAALAPGTSVVVEGRTLLNDGDRVFAARDRTPPRTAEKTP
jgi:RND family efflux transporter MFP subunit